MRLSLCLQATWLGFAALGWLVTITSAEETVGSSGGAQRGPQVSNFELQDYRGETYRLADLQDTKLVVLAFLGTECPLAKMYGPVLQQLADEYADRGVVVWGVNSNSQDSVTEIGAYARRHSIGFPILKDLGNQLADALSAKRTPEVVLLDADRHVRYRGRIDDRFGVGYQRDAATRSDLRVAIDELLAGNDVTLPATEAVGCHIGRVKQPDGDSRVTYSQQIARVLQRRCVECHREGEIAPFALTEYDEVVGWAEMIQEVVADQRMPPWHASPEVGSFANDRHLTNDEKQLIYDWVAHGAPEGDPAQLPEPLDYVAGWQLPREPDVILPLTPEPVTVQDRGEVKYQYYVVDPGFTEDKWIESAQLMPGNRAVVHHILAFARPKDGLNLDADGGGARGFLVGYVPGMMAMSYPPGMAKKIPAGSQLLFQVHYTPIGSEQQDQSRLGIVFANPETLTHEVKTTSAVNPGLRIPAHDANHHEQADSLRMPCDAELLTFMPHMHLRGKAFRYTAVFPDQTEEILLDVPAYDFNWQTAYRLSESRVLPAGTYLHCDAYYDNSEDNLNNPDPSDNVRWGDQTWEEMMIGYFDIAVPLAEAGASWDEAIREQVIVEMAKRLMRRFDKDQDGIVKRDEVPLLGRIRFEIIDTDDDGIVGLEELAESIRKEAKKRNR